MSVPSKLFDLRIISRERHADGHDLLSNKDRMKKREKKQCYFKIFIISIRLNLQNLMSVMI